MKIEDGQGRAFLFRRKKVSDFDINLFCFDMIMWLCGILCNGLRLSNNRVVFVPVNQLLAGSAVNEGSSKRDMREKIYVIVITV